ncbi:FIST C-terminal domain-containing protein [Candidatus Woesearchaeota archaeon]|nr:FIST C-terminal domain-containing protein [Candidatus Woesearchaeota archaeon]
MLSSLGHNDKSTKDLIIEILSKEWPLTSKKIHNKIRKEYGKSVTYQAVFKVIDRLTKEGIVNKENQQYALNLAWLHELNERMTQIEETYLQKQELPRIEVGCGSSVEKDAREAGKEAVLKAMRSIIFYREQIQLVLVFASVKYEEHFAEMLEGIKEVTKTTKIVGGTTVGEICDQRLHGSVSVSVIAAPPEQFSAEIFVIHRQDLFSQKTEQMLETITENKPSFGMILTPGPGTSNNMENIAPSFIDHMREKLPFFLLGGVCGSDWQFRQTYQFVGVNVYSNCIVMIVVTTKLKYSLATKTGYMPLKKDNVYTLKVEEGTIISAAKNDKKQISPIKGFSKEMKISEQEFRKNVPLFIKEMISENRLKPLGDVTNPTQLGWIVDITKNGGLRCNLDFKDGTRVQIMDTTVHQLIESAHEVIHKALMQTEIQKPVLVLLFPCAIFEAILSKNKEDEVRKVKAMNHLQKTPVFGMYTKGEIGRYDGKLSFCNGSVVCLILGE